MDEADVRHDPRHAGAPRDALLRRRARPPRRGADRGHDIARSADVLARRHRQLYGFRWNSELDIRSIKQALNLAHVRCKSPEMVRRELWTTLLGYNLIRTTAAAAAVQHDKLPRQISFIATCQYVLASWTLFSTNRPADNQLLSRCCTLLAQISNCRSRRLSRSNRTP